MPRKKKEEEAIAAGEWLNTYADMVTLLMTFFVLLFAMVASNDQDTVMQILVKAFSSNPEVLSQIEMWENTGTGNEHSPPMLLGVVETAGDHLDTDQSTLNDIFISLINHAREAGIEDSVELLQGDGFVFIRLKDNLAFEPNSSFLRPQARAVLNVLGDGILAVQDQLAVIRIEGHSADVSNPAPDSPSDRVLSTDRANAVLMFFEDVKGIDPRKLQAVGYGKWWPIAPNDVEENRSKNRRVEIFISERDLSRDEMNEIYEQLGQPLQ